MLQSVEKSGRPPSSRDNGMARNPEIASAACAEVFRRDSSAARVLRLLDAFVGSPPLVGLSQLAERARLPKSTAHRLLGTLTHEGYVRRVSDRYCLSNRVFEVGNHVMSCRPHGLREQAMPFLTDLFLQTRQTVHLAVLADGEVLYLEKIFGHSSLRTGTAVGGRRPPHATALGKAMLAHCPSDVVEKMLVKRLEQFTPHTIAPGQLPRHLAEVRAAGFATDRGELISDLNCVAAPIRDVLTGQAIAAVSVSTRKGPELIRKFAASVVQTAAALSSVTAKNILLSP
jgi:DNA-binding IclR family transcriptional regulator